LQQGKECRPCGHSGTKLNGCERPGSIFHFSFQEGTQGPGKSFKFESLKGQEGGLAPASGVKAIQEQKRVLRLRSPNIPRVEIVTVELVFFADK
jgi:hypothetical protein